MNARYGLILEPILIDLELADLFARVRRDVKVLRKERDHQTHSVMWLCESEKFREVDPDSVFNKIPVYYPSITMDGSIKYEEAK